MLGDSDEHSRSDLIVVVEREHEIRPVRSGERRCEPDCRLMVQPRRSRAARTRRAFVAGQLLKRPGTSRSGVRRELRDVRGVRRLPGEPMLEPERLLRRGRRRNTGHQAMPVTRSRRSDRHSGKSTSSTASGRAAGGRDDESMRGLQADAGDAMMSGIRRVCWPRARRFSSAIRPRNTC